MGWTGYPEDNRKAEDIVRSEIEGFSGRYKVIANRGARHWLVEDTTEGRRFATVALVEKRHGYTYTKLLDETCGPCVYNYPLSFLEMLSEPENEYANEWRKKVREHHATKKATPTLKPGDKIVFDEPIEFTNGWSVQRLEFLGKYTFRTPMGSRVRLHKSWKTHYKWRIDN